MTVLAAHQPNYLPWPGYFHKMAGADVFVFLDAVQVPRGTPRGFANRNRIKTPSGVRWLTVPLKRRGPTSYLEAETAGDSWREKHLRTVRQCYARAPCFDAVFPSFAEVLRAGLPFAETNLALVRFFAGLLGLRPRFRRQSELGIEGTSNELLVSLCKRLGCGTYLSGAGAKSYNDAALFEAAGVELVYDEFEPPVYPQLWGEFKPGLSVLDLAMNCGENSREVLLL